MGPNPLERDTMRIQAPARPRVVRGLPPVPPTAPEVKKEGLSKKAVAARIGGATVIGGSSIGAVQHHIEYDEPLTPAGVYRDIQSIPGFWWDLSKSALESIQQMAGNLKKEPVVVPDTFDPKATKGVIGENNSVRMTPEEFKKIAPPELEENRVNIPLIFKLPDGYKGAINYQLNKSSMGIKRKVTTETGEVKEVDVYSNLTLWDLPIGTKIISAWDGEIGQGAVSFQTFSDGSVESLQAQISTSEGVKVHIGTGRIKLEREIPRATSEPVPDRPRESRGVWHTVSIHKGDVIGTIMGTGSIPYASSSTPAQVAINVVDKRGVTNIGFATTPDGKLIVLE